MSETEKTVERNVAYIEKKREFLYDSVPVVDMKIIFPRLSLGNPAAADRINRMYKFTADRFERYAAKHLYRDAVKVYWDAIRQDTSFQVFRAGLVCKETLFSERFFSSYFDRREYSGGAHGQTLRFSDTWDLNTGLPVELCGFFKSRHACRKKILGEVLNMADRQNAENPGFLHKNYRFLIKKRFQPARFHLTQTGVSVYFQQYDIGPGSSGIVTFNLPFAGLFTGPEANIFQNIMAPAE